MTRGGSREGAGRKTGKTHKKVLISLPLNVVEWLENKDNKSGFIAGLVEKKMNTKEYDLYVAKSSSPEDIAKMPIEMIADQIADMIDEGDDALEIATKIKAQAESMI